MIPVARIRETLEHFFTDVTSVSRCPKCQAATKLLADLSVSSVVLSGEEVARIRSVLSDGLLSPYNSRVARARAALALLDGAEEADA